MPALSTILISLPLGTALQDRLARALKRNCATVAIWIGWCRQGYPAAALYDECARLSDAELKRRGWAREELYRKIGEHLGGDLSENRFRHALGAHHKRNHARR